MPQLFENRPSSSEPSLSEVVNELDRTDLDLLKLYDQYLKRPSPHRMKSLSESTDLVIDAYAKVLRKVVQSIEYDAPASDEEKASLLATLLLDMNSKHSELLMNYSDDIKLPTDKEREGLRQSTAECLEDKLQNSKGEFVDEAMGHFRRILDSDMEAVERYMYKKVRLSLASSRRVLPEGVW